MNAGLMSKTIRQPALSGKLDAKRETVWRAMDKLDASLMRRRPAMLGAGPLVPLGGLKQSIALLDGPTDGGWLAKAMDPRDSELIGEAGRSIAATLMRCGLKSASNRTGDPMIEALLSDIDGTLVESNWLHAEAWQGAFAAIGIELNREDVRRQIGKGGDELIPVYVSWWKRRQVEGPLKNYRKFIFQQDYLSKVKALPAARELLVRAKEAGIRVALASSADKDELQIYKRIVGMEELVEKETSANDADRSKPHPDIFVAALERLKLPAEKCMALGDTPYDAEAAGLAGLRTIGVSTGGWSRTELIDAGCVEVYDSVAELLERFENSALVREGLR